MPIRLSISCGLDLRAPSSEERNSAHASRSTPRQWQRHIAESFNFWPSMKCRWFRSLYRAGDGAAVVLSNPLHQSMAGECAARQAIKVKVFDAHLPASLLQSVPKLLRLELLLASPFALQALSISLVPALIPIVLGLEEERNSKHGESKWVGRIHRRAHHLVHGVLEMALADEPVGSHGVADELDRDELMTLGCGGAHRATRESGGGGA